MLNSASKTEKFFYRDEDSTYPFWRLISPEENEIMTNIKSKEARKYIFNCLDDIGQVNVQMDIESSQLLAEKIDRREFIDLLKRMLTIDQERRIQPAQALRHPFTTLSHLVDYAHCNNVKASVQMMEVCRRDPVVHSVPQATATLVNFGPNTTENMTFTINNQLTSQVQRLVRERNPATYDNVYQFYGTPRNVVRQYTNTRAAEVLPPQLSFICPYNPMPSPTTKHVVVGSGMQPSLQAPPQQYVNVPVPVSMTMEPNGQRMLLTNAVQSTVAWPQGGTRQVAIVPSWGQHGAAPHSLIVDSAQFYNVEEIYAKQPLSIHKYEKKESPVHHLNVPRHEKKETNQLSPVKKRVKENTPPHNHHHHHQNNNNQMQQNQQRYSNHRSSSYHHHVSPQQQAPPSNQYHNPSFYGGNQNQNGHYDANQHYPSAVVVNTNGGGGGGSSGKQRHQPQQNHHQIVNSTITINDTPSPTSVILISDSEDEEDQQQQQQQQQQQSSKNSRPTNNNNNNNNQNYSTNTANSSTQCNNNKNENASVISNSASSSSSHHHQQQQRQHRKNVISCVTVGDSDGEDSAAPKPNNNVKYEQHQQQSQKKRLLAMTQNDAQSHSAAPGPSSANQLKQEPTEFASTAVFMNQFEYPPYDHQKRSSWVGPTSSIVQPPIAHAHNMNNKRDSSGSNPGPQQPLIAIPQHHQQQQHQPPIAHIKTDIPSASSSSTSLNTTPIYHHHHHHHRTQPQTQNTTPLGNSPIGTSAALLQPQQADIYAQAELYRRPTVFVSQASYAYNTARVVPPPAHNSNSRQVSLK
jgi:homeodomain interacting protein kinase